MSYFLGRCPAYSQLRGDMFESYYLSINDIFDNLSLRKIVKYAIKTKQGQDLNAAHAIPHYLLFSAINRIISVLPL